MTTDIRTRAIVASLLSTILSSIAWITEREAVLRLSPLFVASISLLLGGVILLVMARFNNSIPSIKSVYENRWEFLTLLITRSICGQLLLIYSLTMTSASKVMFLTKVEPYLIVLWYWIFRGERITTKHFALLTVHLAGAFVLSTGGSFNFSIEQLGDLLVLGGIASNSISYVPAQHLAQKLGALSTSGVVALLGGVLLAPIALIFADNPTLPSGELFTGWVYLLVTVVIFYVFSTVLWYVSLCGMRAWLSSALRCIGPIVAAPIAYLVYDQPLTQAQLVGALIVLATSVMMVRAREI